MRSVAVNPGATGLSPAFALRAIWASRPGPTALFAGLSVLVSGLYFIGFLVAGGLRAVYPYPLDGMEDANLQVVRHILRGQPVYGPPTLTYIPVIYPPIYFLLSAVVALLTGPSLIPLRVVSLVASLGATALVYRMVQREVGSKIAGMISAAVFVGSTQLSIGSLDLGRVDALGVFFLLASLYAMRTADLHPSAQARACAISGLMAGLAVMTKQTNAIAAVALLGYAALSPRVRLVPYAVALLASTGLLFAMLFAHDGGWAKYYLFDLPATHVLDERHMGNFWTLDIFPRFTLPLVIGPLFLVSRAARREIRTFAFYLLASVAMLALAWGGWANRGAGANVYEPAFAILSILFGLGLSEGLTLLSGHTSDLRLMRNYVMAIGLAQFVILGYNPRTSVPLRSDGWAGDRLTATLAALPGTVFAPSHGEWAYRAGKGDQPSSTTVMEITGAFSLVPTPEGERWLNEFSAALARREYDYVIWDPGYLDALVIKSRVEGAGYVDAGPLFPPDDQFYLWKTGTTPEVEEYVPRERLGRGSN
jgi:hypothetical protein